jgi:hypothetical protein
MQMIRHNLRACQKTVPINSIGCSDRRARLHLSVRRSGQTRHDVHDDTMHFILLAFARSTQSMELPRCHCRNLVSAGSRSSYLLPCWLSILLPISPTRLQGSSTVTLQKQVYERSKTHSFDVGFVCLARLKTSTYCTDTSQHDLTTPCQMQR